jgi:hypothetical protein
MALFPHFCEKTKSSFMDRMLALLFKLTQIGHLTSPDIYRSWPIGGPVRSPARDPLPLGGRARGGESRQLGLRIRFWADAFQTQQRPFTNCEWRLRRICLIPRDPSPRWVDGHGYADATVEIHPYGNVCQDRHSCHGVSLSQRGDRRRVIPVRASGWGHPFQYD